MPTLFGAKKNITMYRRVVSLGRKVLFRLPVLPTYLIEEAGLTRIGDFNPQDIFIVGYPKSGNTWFQHMVCELVYGIDTRIAPDALIEQLTGADDSKSYYSRVSTPMYFKSHFLPRPEYRRVVYLLRDGRDAMVSYFHHIKAIEHLSELDKMDVVRNGTYLSPCKWYEHVERWLENPYTANILLIKYEDMKTSPAEVLHKFCDFAGIDRDDSYIEQVIARTSFSEMKKKEVAVGWANENWPKDQTFVRRGIVGSYKDEMPPDVLTEFLEQSAATLRKVGYSVD
ncbi:MAG: sulfotransferase domain-containing protein [Chloroflexota bacterium]